MIYEPLTKLQCCPTSDGSAAAILASEQFVIDNCLQEKVSSAFIMFHTHLYMMMYDFMTSIYDFMTFYTSQ